MSVSHLKTDVGRGGCKCKMVTNVQWTHHQQQVLHRWLTAGAACVVVQVWEGQQGCQLAVTSTRSLLRHFFSTHTFQQMRLLVSPDDGLFSQHQALQFLVVRRICWGAESGRVVQTERWQGDAEHSENSERRDVLVKSVGSFSSVSFKTYFCRRLCSWSCRAVRSTMCLLCSWRSCACSSSLWQRRSLSNNWTTRREWRSPRLNGSVNRRQNERKYKGYSGSGKRRGGEEKPAVIHVSSAATRGGFKIKNSDVRKLQNNNENIWPAGASQDWVSS